MSEAGKKPGLPWLDALERSAHQAVERLTELAAENARLEARIEELEAGGDAAAAGPDAAAWHRERDEIRHRLHKLTATLETLLAQPPD